MKSPLKWLARRSAQNMVEYALILSLVSAVGLIGSRQLGTSVKSVTGGLFASTSAGGAGDDGSADARGFLLADTTTLSEPAATVTYYVDAAQGSDSNAGTSPGEAWKTLGKVSGTSLNPGDTVLLKRGCVWRERLKVPSSGTQSAPITIGSYDSGPRPTIKGSRASDEDGCQWVSSGGGANEYYLVKNGRNPGYAMPGDLYDRPGWVWYKAGPTRLTRGTVGALQDGEWGWGDNDGLGFSTIYVRNDSGQPGGIEIPQSTDGAVVIIGKSHIVVRELAVKFANLMPGMFACDGAHHITVEDCEFAYNFQTGLSIYGTRGSDLDAYATISNCVAHDNGGHGIVASGTEGRPAGKTRHVTVENCVAYGQVRSYFGDRDGYGIKFDFVDDSSIVGCESYGNYLTGIHLDGNTGEEPEWLAGCDGNEIAGNDVHDNGGNGIVLEVSSQNRVYDNKVYDNGKEHNWCGSIAVEWHAKDNLIHHNQLFGSSSGPVLGVRWSSTGTQVIHNTVVCGHQAMNVIADSVQGTTIHNNIIQSASFDCVLGSASGVVSNHNNWCGSGKKFYIGGHWPPYSLEQWRDMTGQDLNSMIADPLFVDPSTDDFHLTESSPCIDAGTEVGLAFEGEAPDLGALEYSTGGDDPPPSDPPPEDPPPPPEEPPNQEPTISALVTSPPADLLTITALGVQDPDGTVTEVRFYRDANGDGVLQVEMDIFLGNGTSHSPEWDVQTNTTDWSSGTHTLFARAYDDDSAYCEASTQVTIGMGEAGEIEGPNGVVVYIFDCDEIKDVDPADIRVKFGKGTVVSTIQLSGTQPMSALGILVSGASQVGTVKDGRSGAKADVAFIASDSPIKTISLKSGMVGADLESYAEGLVELHPDFPGGITAIYSEGSLGTLKVEGDIEGNIWVGGADSKGRAVNSFILKNGHYHGDMVAKGDVNKVCVAGDFGSSIQVTGEMTTLQVKGGDFGGTVDVGGALAKLEVKPSKRVGGNITAGAHVRAGGLLKKVNICGSLQGGSAEENLVQVLAPSIGTVTITGDVQNSRMLAGADLGNDWRLGGTGSDADCFSAGRIDKIRVKGRVTDSLIGSGLPCAPDNRFDLTWLTENHAFIGGSRIGGLQINRDLTSTATDGTPYGVGSYEIGDAKVGSTKVHPLVVSEI